MNTISTEIWEGLTSPSDYIRWQTAKRPDLTREAIIVSLSDKEWSVRLAAVMNPLCPDDLLKEATADPSRHVRNFAQDTIAGRTRA